MLADSAPVWLWPPMLGDGMERLIKLVMHLLSPQGELKDCGGAGLWSDMEVGRPLHL
jgi:hypothetical protein